MAPVTPSLPVRHKLPKAPRGARIGLFGGSFDPAHRGHVHITRAALKRLGLDQVWWLVTPGNPLKARGPAPLADRMEKARARMRHTRVKITDIEAHLGTRYTADTLAALQRLYPRVTFVWIMGADNLAGFHHWEDWRRIMATVPVAVFARPGARLAARSSVAARSHAKARLTGRALRRLADHAPPVWGFVHVPLQDISSTALRARGG